MTKSWKDYIKECGEGTKPGVEIKINSKEWKSDDIEISNVVVSSSILGEAGTCSVELVSRSPIKYDLLGKIDLNSDFSDVKVGVELEVTLGYISKDIITNKESVDGEVVFTGYISAFDLEFDDRKSSRITIQGMDAKLWMMTNKTTELKKDKKKYSDIVKGICSDYSGKLNGNKVDISGEVSFEKEIYQRNESDYEFLTRVANLTGSLFFIDRLGKLYFVSPSSLKKTELKITPEEGVMNLRLSVSVWGIPKSVEVVGIDQKDYQALVEGKATTSETIGDGKDATSLTNNINKNNTIRIVDNTIRSANEAKFLAESIYNMRELDLAEVNLELYGYPKVELATGVKLDSFDKPVDNDYIVTKIQHNYSANPRKYTTNLTLKTNRVRPK